MREISDVLTVSFVSGLKDEAALCVARKDGEKTVILKMELGKQADILYHLLTEQKAKAEVGRNLCDSCKEEMLKYQQYLHGKMSNEENHKLWKFIKELPSVIPEQKTGKWIKLKDQKPEDYEDVLVKDIDGDVTCAYLCDEVDFLERFSGELVEDVVEWMEMPK